MLFTRKGPIGAGLSGYIAEMGSAFRCARLGIAPAVRGTAGPRGRAIFRAARRAADFLMGFPTEQPAGEGPEADKLLWPGADKRLRRAA